MVYGHLSASNIKTERRKLGLCIYAQLVQGRVGGLPGFFFFLENSVFFKCYFLLFYVLFLHQKT